jgi:hypothetical protein
MQTITIYDSFGIVCEPNSRKTVFSTEDWYVDLIKGRMKKRFHGTLFKCNYFYKYYNCKNTLHFRMYLEHATGRIDLYWRCENGTNRMFLLNVLCSSTKELDISLEK